MDPENHIYLDNAATTPVSPAIADKIKDIMINGYGNPSSLHALGLAAAQHIRSARATIASCLGVSEEEIIFTSGASESNSLALLGAALAQRRKGRHIIYSSIEHPSVIEPLKLLGQYGFAAEACPVNRRGMVEPQVLEGMIRPDTILVSIMTVNNEIGSVQRLPDLVQAARRVNPGVCFHSDGVQAFGKIPVKPRQLGIDMLSMSAHKIHGPKGAGGLYIRKGLAWKSLSLGGGQEGGRRSGTENVPAIAGLAMAASDAHLNLESNRRHLFGLKAYLLQLLNDRGLPFGVNGPDPLDAMDSAPHILNLSFSGIRGEVLAHFLEKDHIYISTGSACSSQKTKTSHVLKAMNLSADQADSAIRISFSPLNTQAEVVSLVDSLSQAVERIGVLV